MKMRGNTSGKVNLAAGAIGSPHLLQISGVGAADHLSRIGCDVRHNLPAVGANLQDHYATRLTYRVHGADTISNRAADFRCSQRLLNIVSVKNQYCSSALRRFCFKVDKASLIQIFRLISHPEHTNGMQSLEKKQDLWQAAQAKSVMSERKTNRFSI